MAILKHWLLVGLFTVLSVAAMGQTGPAASQPVAPKNNVRLTTLLLPLEANHVDPALASTLDDVIAAHLQARRDLKVVTLEDLNTMLEAERLKDLAGCDDVACSTELGGAVGADRILAGRLGRIGEQYVLGLRWLDAVFSQALARHTEEIPLMEARLPDAARQGVDALLRQSAGDDTETRKLKRHPTFWTAELSAAVGVRPLAEPYNAGLGGTARLAWGGRAHAIPVYLYILAGLGLSDYWGSKRGPAGKVKYNRTQFNPFLEVRAAIPVGWRRRGRIFAGAGLGVEWEFYRGKQGKGLRVDGTHVFQELRLLTGFWWRWQRNTSLFANYRLRIVFAGKGVDPISELVQVSGSLARVFHHELEGGVAWHF